MNGPSHGARERGMFQAAVLCLIDLMLIGGVALHSSSLTILSDFLKEFTDFLAMLAAWLTVRAVSRASDEHYAYGIGKLENLVSVAIAILMLACAGFVLHKALGGFADPQPVTGTLPGIVIFAAYAFVGFAMSWRSRRALLAQPSPILESQARLWFSKGAFDASMAIALTLEIVFHDYAWSRYLDPAASIVGVAFLLHAARAIVTASVGDLLDASLEEPLQLRIFNALVEYFDSYEGVDEIRTRRAGARVFIEVFLTFDPGLMLREARQRMDLIEAGIRAAIPGADVCVIPRVAPGLAPA